MKQLTYEELKRWEAEKKSFQIIDVREKEEHLAFNIGGALIPLGEIQKNVEKLELHLPIVFYCKRGIRSQIAIQRLSKRIDTANFYNLHKGILHLMPV
jgi:adenylyltransferase/sulfurtransferase